MRKWRDTFKEIAKLSYDINRKKVPVTIDKGRENVVFADRSNWSSNWWEYFAFNQS